MLKALSTKLFLSCWIIFCLHFATDFVREHYLVLSMVEDHSYRLDQYYGMHVDIFQNPPHAKEPGAHHGANPGMSMVAAIPYFVLRPAVDAVVDRELVARRARGDTAKAVYNDPRPRRVAFYTKLRALGLDVRFGLVSLITLVFCMAPISAAGVVLMNAVLRRVGLSDKLALGFSLLLAFGTPVFLRTGYLNQNLAIGWFSFAAFALLWNPQALSAWSERTRFVVAGLLGGLSFLCDYSGAILMGLLGLYAWSRAADSRGPVGGFRQSLWYGLGCIPGTLLLWHYQYESFGNPFLPPQNWMAPVEWIDVGYKGVGGFVPELFRLLLLEPRYGLFWTMPIAALAFLAPVLRRFDFPALMAKREILVALGLSLAEILFFSTVQYTRLQWVTGIRYLAAVFPFLFFAAVPVLMRLPRVVLGSVVLASLVINWSIAMVRSQGSVIENITRVFVEGFQLPAVTVLTKLAAQYLPWYRGIISPLPLFVVAGGVIWFLWSVRDPWAPIQSSEKSGV